MNVAEIRHLKLSFGSNHVLKDINLKIEQGENLVVLGKSGSGKSVLIKCMVGLITPDDGEIILFNSPIHNLNSGKLNAIRKKVGFLFQSGALYDSMTVRENIAFPLKDILQMSKKEKERLVIESLENVGLEHAINKMPAELSGGMRKRVGLARALILKPELMLYDEPTTGLDPITAKEISHLIVDIQKKYNTSSIVITHDIECARITATRIIMLRDGISAEEGTFKELSASQDTWVNSFFK